MRLTCLFEEGYVADTATVSDAIDDQKTVKILLLPFPPFQVFKDRKGEIYIWCMKAKQGHWITAAAFCMMHYRRPVRPCGM
ncbi:MAG: hypothetical protein N2V77_07505, partial [Canidatus Methanoxibalbensis ujae]|nr:hypothetical protein [Candidatus Methanoxibalbensis ujae]